MKSNGKKRANKSLWKYLATRDREREARKAAKLARNGGGGAPDEANGADAGESLPSNKWSRKKNEWSHRRSDPLLFFKPAHPTFQARFRQAACSASHNSL